ncbi:unnamed protein product [Amoebophrya sp. A120]|nr:unnamed protein product [Amoebophrya sp. A120]|eukprot:GSA120T00000590001.1
MPLHLCGSGYECVSHVKAFGLGHSADVAASRVKFWQEKMGSSMTGAKVVAGGSSSGTGAATNGALSTSTSSSPPSIATAQESEFHSYTKLAKALQKPESDLIPRVDVNSATPIYEVGCPFRGKSLGFGSMSGGPAACYPNDSSTAALDASNKCSWCHGWSAEGYEDAICKNDENDVNGLKPCMCVLKASPGMERRTVDLSDMQLAQPSDASAYLAYHKLKPFEGSSSGGTTASSEEGVPLVEQQTEDDHADDKGLIVIPHYYMPRQGPDMFAQNPKVPAFSEDQKHSDFLWGSLWSGSGGNNSGDSYKEDIARDLGTLESDLNMAMTKYDKIKHGTAVNGDPATENICPPGVTTQEMLENARMVGQYEHWKERCEKMEKAHWAMQNPHMTKSEWQSTFRNAPKCDFEMISLSDYTRFRHVMQHCLVNVRSKVEKDLALMQPVFSVPKTVAKAVQKADGGAVHPVSEEDAENAKEAETEQEESTEKTAEVSSKEGDAETKAEEDSEKATADAKAKAAEKEDSTGAAAGAAGEEESKSAQDKDDAEEEQEGKEASESAKKEAEAAKADDKSEEEKEEEAGGATADDKGEASETTPDVEKPKEASVLGSVTGTSYGLVAAQMFLAAVRSSTSRSTCTEDNFEQAENDLQKFCDRVSKRGTSRPLSIAVFL